MTTTVQTQDEGARVCAGIRRILKDIEIIDEYRFSNEGKTTDARNVRNPVTTVGQGLPPVVTGVAEAVYWLHHARYDDGRGNYAWMRDVNSNVAYQGSLLSRLELKVRQDEGWQVGDLAQEGRLTVHKDGRRMQLWPSLVEMRPDGMADISIPLASTERLKGWWHVQGETEFHPSRGEAGTRTYFNLSRAGSVAFTARLVNSLNRARLPFQYKIVDDPDRFCRSDSAVLYTPRQQWAQVQSAVAAACREAWPYLRSPTSRLALRIGPGVAVADHPSRGVTFGVHRAVLVAEGLWQAHNHGSDAATGVAERFNAAGLDASRPHLEDSAKRNYDIPEIPDRMSSLIREVLG